MTKNPKKSKIPSQRRRFIEAARAAECSEDEAKFDRTIKRIAKPKASGSKKAPKK